MVAPEQVAELIYEQATDVNDQIREQMEDWNDKNWTHKNTA
jgi:hypothetical protein